MDNEPKQSMTMTNLLLAGNLYTNHKIGKNLTSIGDNQRAIQSAVHGLGNDLKKGIANLSGQISKTNNLLEKGNKITAAQLKVQTSMAAQQQIEYLEKKQNDLIRDTFFNIAQEYKKINNDLSNDTLNKHLHLCSVKACINENKIDSSIATSMEDKTFIAEIIENIDNDITSTFDAFNEKHKDSYNQMLEILNKDEEKEISKIKNNIKKAKENIADEQFFLDGIKKIEKEIKTYIDFVEKNLLYATVILFEDDLYFRYKQKDNMKVYFSTLENLKGILSTCDEDEVKAEIDWFDGQKYFRGNTLYQACYYSKVLEKYTAIHELDQKYRLGFIEKIKKLIQKNISILSNPIYLEFRKNLVFRCVDKKKWKECEKIRKRMNKQLSEDIAGEWWINIDSIEAESILTPENIKALEILFKIINKAYSLTKNEIHEETDDAIKKNKDTVKEIEKMESKINKLRDAIKDEIKIASNLYKDYPAMKLIIKNR